MRDECFEEQDAEFFRVDFMRPEHLDQVMSIELKSFKDPWSRELFLSELRNPAAVYFVVLNQEGRVVAYAGFWKVLDEGHIMNIAVDPDFRGMGIGSSLLANVIDYASALNIRHLTLEVRESNTVAISLYLKHGFRTEGIRKGYYPDGENAIIMWKRDMD